MSIFESFNLSTIPEDKQNIAIKALKDRDETYLLLQVYTNAEIQFVADNIDSLLNLGLYEKVLVMSYKTYQPNRSPYTSNEGLKDLLKSDPKIYYSLYYANMQYSQKFISELLEKGDKEKLLKSGDPLPVKDEYILYRGTPNVKESKNIKGISWTSDLNIAKNFAYHIYKPEDSIAPGVFQTTVNKESIYFYFNYEEEYVIDVRHDIDVILVE